MDTANIKKKLPLSILEAIQPVLNKNRDLIKPITDTKYLFHLIESDTPTTFYFIIIKQEIRNYEVSCFVERLPASKDNINASSQFLSIKETIESLTDWIEILDSYNNIHTIYDDPIIKSYEESFSNQFNIVEEDANYAPFNLQQQMFIEDYLTNVKSKINTLKIGRSEQEIKELSEIENEAEEIQNSLSKESKRKVIKRLTKLWAKAQKVGLDVLKEIFVNVAAELTKQLLIGGN